MICVAKKSPLLSRAPDHGSVLITSSDNSPLFPASSPASARTRSSNDLISWTTISSSQPFRSPELEPRDGIPASATRAALNIIFPAVVEG
jgi:hypothetical protein